MPSNARLVFERDPNRSDFPDECEKGDFSFRELNLRSAYRISDDLCRMHQIVEISENCEHHFQCFLQMNTLLFIPCVFDHFLDIDMRVSAFQRHPCIRL